MKKIIFMLAVAMIFSAKMSRADDLVPATSEDQQKFDQQVSQNEDSPQAPQKGKDATDTNKDAQGKSADHRQDADHTNRDHTKHKKDKKANFGQLVSAEAKKLKAEGKDQKNEMGQWVSDQRRKNTQQGSAGQAGGSSNSGGSAASSDARSSAPGLSDSGSSSGTSGKSGDHRK